MAGLVVKSGCWSQPEFKSCSCKSRSVGLGASGPLGLCCPICHLGITTAPTSYQLSQGKLVLMLIPEICQGAHTLARSISVPEEGSERLWAGFLGGLGELGESDKGWGRVHGLIHHPFLLSPSRRWASGTTTTTTIAVTSSTS